MTPEQINKQTITSGNVTISTYLYEALLHEQNLIDKSVNNTLARLSKVKMVVSPITQKDRLNNIEYICNHVINDNGDHLLCFTMSPYIAKLNQIVIKISANHLQHLRSAIAFHQDYPCIDLQSAVQLVHSNYPSTSIQQLEFLEFSLNIVQKGVQLKSEFAMGLVGQKSYSVNVVSLTAENYQSVHLIDESFPLVFHSTPIEDEFCYQTNELIDLGTKACSKSTAHYEKTKLSLMIDENTNDSGIKAFGL
jgi:hypothetical protein